MLFFRIYTEKEKKGKGGRYKAKRRDNISRYIYRVAVFRKVYKRGIDLLLVAPQSSFLFVARKMFSVSDRAR